MANTTEKINTTTKEKANPKKDSASGWQTSPERQNILDLLNSAEPVEDTEETDTTSVVSVVEQGKKDREARDYAEAKKNMETVQKQQARMEQNRLQAEEEAKLAKRAERREAEKEKERRQRAIAIFAAGAVCFSSAIFQFIVAGVCFKLFVNPNDILFSIVIAVLAIVIVSIHMFAYKAIREQIGRKVYRYRGEI